MTVQRITPVFVEFIPEHVEEGKLYISESYQTAIHKCCCGCGEEVVTPLSPVGWQIRKGVRGVSLYPSIGNWRYKCQSHYFIQNNQVIWAGAFSQKQIENVLLRDQLAKQHYIESRYKASQPTLSGIGALLYNLWKSIKSIIGFK